jgi:hypothetical protein
MKGNRQWVIADELHVKPASIFPGLEWLHKGRCRCYTIPHRASAIACPSEDMCLLVMH